MEAIPRHAEVSPYSRGIAGVRAIAPVAFIDRVAEPAAHPLLARGGLAAVQSDLAGHQGDGRVASGAESHGGFAALEGEQFLHGEVGGVGGARGVQGALPVRVDRGVARAAGLGCGVGARGHQCVGAVAGLRRREEVARVVGLPVALELPATALLETTTVKCGQGIRDDELGKTKDGRGDKYVYEKQSNRKKKE